MLKTGGYLVNKFNIDGIKFSFDTKSFKNGIYYLQLQSEKGLIIKKITINN